MRRYKKKELLETADMLVEANEVIGRLCKSNTDGALELLGQCQESAILLGNLIESKGDGYAELVEILENYCENIYQMSIAISAEEQIRKLSKKIQKQLIYLNNKIQHEIPEDKKEVVFFPYKASMWDSLESVWMAADADEDTDAYVVPIPYYDKNPDGTFREMHYEGDQYPDYVPVTNYEEYDFEERRPDIIFIHNPYDQFNYVTSVHPRFYSGNLKQYTEKLVYIPYFILGEIKPDDEEALKGMKHFCINEAVKNADKVIVQSEDMRQVYIKVLTEESGGSKEARDYWEKKIDGSGSPKVDKVLRTKKEDLEIPEEWLKVIQKPDGSWKKIVFYNTSVTALLQYDEQMLKKIENVFQIFQENKDEVAFLWRPHPLMESTLVSMRPELWENYRKIREKYREKGWGIYDDTADVDRAIILSDAYYGDGSSIVQLYQKTGKPVMLQNVNAINAEEEEQSKVCKVVIGDAIILNNKIWFFSINFRGLFSMDVTSKTVEYFDIPSKMLYSQKNAFGSMALMGSKIYLIPHNEKSIFCFDINDKEFKKIELNKKITDCNKTLFMGIGKYQKYLFIMGTEIPIIIRLNTEDDSIEYITQWEKDIKKLVFDSRDAYFRKQCIILKNKLFVPFCNANAVLELDCDSLKTVIHIVGMEKQGYSGICYDGNSFWLSPRRSGSLVKWNNKTGLERSVMINKTGKELESLSFVGITYYDKRICLLPFYGEGGESQIGSGEIIILQGQYFFLYEEADSIIYYEKEQGVLTKINKGKNEISRIGIRINCEEVNISLIMKEQENYVLETEEINVLQLMKVLKNKENELFLHSDILGVGKEIYEYSIYTV